MLHQTFHHVAWAAVLLAGCSRSPGPAPAVAVDRAAQAEAVAVTAENTENTTEFADQFVDRILSDQDLRVVVVNEPGFNDGHLAKLAGHGLLQLIILDGTDVTVAGIKSVLREHPHLLIRRSQHCVMQLDGVSFGPLYYAGCETCSWEELLEHPIVGEMFVDASTNQPLIFGMIENGESHFLDIREATFLQDDALANLARFCTLRTLFVKGPGVTDRGIECLSACPQLS